MSYEQALEAAGATVHVFEQFGSYQGEWFALVTYNGERGWINGAYGSCSGCDAFHGEFGYSDDKCDGHSWQGEKADCPECDAAKAAYESRLADFGRGYLEDLMTQEQAESAASRYIEWDSEAETMLAFVKANATTESGHETV